MTRGLGPDRVHIIGETPHLHEQEAIHFVRENLPNNDPYHLWALFDVQSHTRSLECDILVLGYSALYLIEAKAYSGAIAGDATDWCWRRENGPEKWVDAPLRSCAFKARVLGSELKRQVRDARLVPWVEPLVFLSHTEDVSLDGVAGNKVVTKSTIARALTHAEYPGGDPSRSRVNRKQIEAVIDALKRLGIRPRKSKRLAGNYEVLDLLFQGDGFEDRSARHVETDIPARARVFLAPDQIDKERKRRLQRAAEREFRLLHQVRAHEDVLSVRDFTRDAPFGPTLIFDDFDGAPLDAFVRTNGPLDDSDKLQILQKVARALDYCHSVDLFHGGISPEAVLVRRNDDDSLSVRLHHFQLGEAKSVTGTRHLSQLASDDALLYQAPELSEAGQERSVATDMFSFGALAYFLFAGRAPELRGRDFEYLDLHVVDEDAHDDLALLIMDATSVRPADRFPSAVALTEAIFDVLTRTPEDETPVIDPLSASEGDVLPGELTVEGELGVGATSRVLAVVRDSGEPLALKVSVSESNNDRVESEAKVLHGLRHDRIVAIKEPREGEALRIGGRSCILMERAGNQTLREYLDDEGTVSLEFAERFGVDLLRVLECLEESFVTHRDIKPQNLGIGSRRKGKRQLTVFDFSLSADKPSEVTTGTLAYRDPFLRQRGEWDAAADRWSAAVTLHEMLTGVRPHLSGAAAEPSSVILLSTERMDPSVSSRLTRFFEKALHREVASRFANAEVMREAWVKALRGADESEHKPLEVGSVDFASLPLSTAVVAVPLSNRAKNALHRNGIETGEAFLALPSSRFVAMRGVGRKVADELLDFHRAWSEAFSAKKEELQVEPFAAQEVDARLLDGRLPHAAVKRFADAGIRNTQDLARAPKRQVEALARGVALSVETLRTVLVDDERADGTNEPSLKVILEELLRGKAGQNVVMLMGLSVPFLGDLSVGARQVAESAGKERATIYAALATLREKRWNHAASVEAAALSANEMLDVGGRAMLLSAAAERLALRYPPSDDAHRSLGALPADVVRAAALLRIAAHVDKDDPSGLRVVLVNGRRWLCDNQDAAQVLRDLGKRADALAARAVLVAKDEAVRVLQDGVAGTALSAFDHAQLLQVAVDASKRAALSTRRQIYPKGLGPERALRHVASVFSMGSKRDLLLTPERVQKRVSEIFPHAAPLPARPALDPLLASHGLHFDSASGGYAPQSTVGTLASRMSTMVPRSRRSKKVVAEGADVVRKLQVANERGVFRVAAVPLRHAERVGARLAEALGVAPTPLDARLIGAIDAVAAEKGIPSETVRQADAAGPQSAHFKKLVAHVIEPAEQRLLAELREEARERPLVLTRPGLSARYQRAKVLEGLFCAARDEDDIRAVIVVVPAVDAPGVPKIARTFPVPLCRAEHVIEVPRGFSAA